MKIKLEHILLIIAAAVILYLTQCSGNDSEQLKMYEASQEELVQTRNKLGQQISKVSVLEASKKKDFLKMKTDDSTIIALQKVVEDAKGKLASATVLNNSTSDTGSTTTITKWDTLFTDTGHVISPVYHSGWQDEWSQGTIKASKDYIERDIKIWNKYEITQSKESPGFLKKRKSVVTIKNLNPNTITEEIRTFTVTPRKNKISFGIGVMYGIDLLQFKPTIVIGPTINIPIISL